MGIDLPLIWALLIAFGVLAYVVLDGFDLGVGILFPLFRRRRQHDVMINAIAPAWDGNETWLVLGGAALFGAFPQAYAVILTALYAPLIAMLLGLIFRGVAFEFRFRSTGNKATWDWAFAGGSTLAAFCQGVALGAFVQGIAVADGAYVGGWWDWLSPFSVLTGFALVVGYALLGACWLIAKTEGELHERLRRVALPLAAGLVILIAAVSLWTPFLAERYAERWFTWPNIAWLSPVPVLVALLAVLFYRAVVRGPDIAPFLVALGFFVLSYIGLGISVFPLVIPPSVTIWQAASPDASLEFLLVGAGILIPIILAYTAYSYWVFRGKASADEGYH